MKKAIRHLFLFIFFMSARLFAGLYYEHATSVAGGMFNSISRLTGDSSQNRAGDSKSVIYIKDNRLRMDYFNGGQMSASLLVSMENKEMISLNHEHKTYSQTSFRQFISQPSPPPQNLRVSTSITDMNEKKRINGFEVHRYKITTRFLMPDDIARLGEFELASDLWVHKKKNDSVAFYQFRNNLLEELKNKKEAKSLFPPMHLLQDQRIQMGLDEILKFAKENNCTPIRIESSLNIQRLLSVSGTKNPAASESINDPFDAEGLKKSAVQLYKITNEVRQIHRSSLKNSLFEIPPNYRRVQD